MSDLLPGLRGVIIHLWGMLAEEWEAFLAEASGRLARVKKVMLGVRISQTAGTKNMQTSMAGFSKYR